LLNPEKRKEKGTDEIVGGENEKGTKLGGSARA